MKEDVIVNTIVLLFVGLIVGIIVISLGGGGGAIYLGLLASVFKISPLSAAATSLVTSLPSVIIGSWGYYRQKQINFRLGNQMLFSAVPAVVIGALLAPYIPSLIYRWVLGLILIIMGLRIVIRKGNRSSNKNHTLWMASLYGVLSGLMVGIAGMSGGGPILAGLLILGLNTFQAVATSSYVLVGLSIIGALMHMTGGQVDWQLGLPLMIGAAVGALIAPLLVKKISKSSHSNIVQVIMALLMVLMGINTIR
ncbi:sulfite exporter TauE/SafE family protein [Secundilactobacillus hailunensis]|uniref:Probable membrane transporter protein n=1 Tax=Secundilactobacillus hailunensis TaxID=2559923 RepID=A0ABW1T7F4_9LACO|nr:sulfite exporter TauE/SafE family protein [Secundilactobacillus hailunensis]